MIPTSKRRTRAGVVLVAALALAGSAGCTRNRPGGPPRPTTPTPTAPGPTTPAPTTPGPSNPGGPGLPAATNYDTAGPFATTTTAQGAHTYFHPTDLGRGGVRHPVILWGNGTGTTPTIYSGLLRHLASHGFIVAAANTTNAGSGREMLAGLDYLTTANGAAGNKFNGAVDTTRVATSGHSQGGMGSLAAARDPRVRTAIPVEGAFSGLSGSGKSALFLAGQNDAIINPSSVRSAFSRSSVPAAYAELAGATHFTPIGNGGAFRGVITAWARWQLAGDTNARDLFVGPTCGLCNNRTWSQYQANAQLATA